MLRIANNREIKNKSNEATKSHGIAAVLIVKAETYICFELTPIPWLQAEFQHPCSDQPLKWQPHITYRLVHDYA